MDTTTEISPTPCPIPGHNDFVLVPGAVICHRSWVAITRMCRGKRRYTQEKAEWMTSVRPWIRAYACDVCLEWHNGNPTDDHDLIHSMVRDAMAILVETKGPYWLTNTLFKFDPVNGHFDRERRMDGVSCST